ncbi:hypothetical protein HU200_036507 [Digitaria exilis]|uniref:Uncharacterized protein n=1 Tax=Digitaria exilis TaxID=1010633 RepID=A0A835EKA7_9POAL|nr:hypothetical protein HU200_036507 [Digitaria exilis]
MAANSPEKARVLEQCERDLDLAIERLINLRLDPDHDAGEGAAPYVSVSGDGVHRAPAAAETQTAAVVPAPASSGGSGRTLTREEWIERLVGEMAGAADAGDARARAAGFLEEFVAAERDVALWQNGVLKKAVLVQHRLYQAKEAANRELRRQLAACQERVRSLETDKYALSMYLRQAQPQGGSMTGPFHPAVF